MFDLKEIRYILNNVKLIGEMLDLKFIVFSNDFNIEMSNLDMNNTSKVMADIKCCHKNHASKEFQENNYQNDQVIFKQKDEFHFLYKPILINKDLLGGIVQIFINHIDKEKLFRNKDSYINNIKEISKLIELQICNCEKTKSIENDNIQLKNILNYIPIGLILINKQGIIQGCNNITKEKLGIKESNFNTLSISNIFNNINIYPLVNGKQTSLYSEALCKKNQMLYKLLLFPIDIKSKSGSIVIVIEDINSPRNGNGNSNFQYKPIKFEDIIGEDDRFRKLKDFARNISSKEADILILGESGTGKEVFARAVHNSSNRSNGPFIAINCSAIPNELLESELFGYEGGAFTGASKNGKPGKFELANGGTLFLDEIGDMSFYLQAKLLRVVQERVIERVGGTKSISIDVKIIAATNKNLQKMVSEGTFREDLYYRLNVIPILLPAVRERKGDIKILIEHFLNKYNNLYGNNISKVEEKAMDVLLSYDWPGNVREIENTIQFLCCVSASGIIKEDLVLRRLHLINKKNKIEKEDSIIIPLQELEYNAIKNAIKVCGNTTEGKAKAASALGIGKSTLYKKIKEYEDRL